MNDNDYNKQMNKDTYSLRKRAMGFIYDMKEYGFILPRIRVRITNDDRHNVAGWGSDKSIWIAEKAVGMSDDFLRQLVAHELVHAVIDYKGHDERCGLMKSAIETPMNKKDCFKHLSKYIKLNLVD